MNKENKLIKKVKRLIRKAGLPRWLHKYGPKKYELWHHLIALLVREFCKLSYRRVKQLFDLLGFLCPSKSALQYNAKKIPAALWQHLLTTTTSLQANVVALDATTFTRSSPSFHYLHRIDRLKPVGKPVKLSILVNTKTKKILAARLRSKAVGDCKDVKQLLKNIQAKTFVADKGYDSEQVHEHLFNKGMKAHIPLRKNARRGFFRMKASKHFNLRIYHRREISESSFSSLKRKFGTSVKCRSARTQRAEMFCRLLLQNMISLFKIRFRTQPIFRITI
ncbi:MAG: IS5 family transposase [Planctomycetota bacterium]